MKLKKILALIIFTVLCSSFAASTTQTASIQAMFSGPGEEFGNNFECVGGRGWCGVLPPGN